MLAMSYDTFNHFLLNVWILQNAHHAFSKHSIYMKVEFNHLYKAIHVNIKYEKTIKKKSPPNYKLFLK